MLQHRQYDQSIHRTAQHRPEVAGCRENLMRLLLMR
jgi:hypothetical protein